LRRRARGPVLLIGEGANRLNAGEKRQRFNQARGEACEAAVAVELAAAPGLVPAAEAEALLAADDKVAAMLTGLIRKHSGTREGVSSRSGSGSGGPDPAYRSVSDFQSGPGGSTTLTQGLPIGGRVFSWASTASFFVASTFAHPARET